jgi:hypothetical protein
MKEKVMDIKLEMYFKSENMFAEEDSERAQALVESDFESRDLEEE